MIDWDLEAPGLESFFYQSKQELDAVRSQLGLIDMLTAYKRMFPRLPLQRTQAPAVSGEPTGKLSAATLEVLEERLPPVSSMLYPIHAPNASAYNHAGALWLLPAGWRLETPDDSDQRFASYAQTVQDFNWSDFYLSFEGEAYFEWLRRQLTAEELADIVLVDSRTGVTEMSGVCTRQLASVVVAFCAPNFQNLDGVERMVRSFTRPEIIKQRQRELPVIVVPSRIDPFELRLRKEFGDRFNQKFGKPPAAFEAVRKTFWDLAIPYIAAYNYFERIVFNAPDVVGELEKAYKQLAAHLVLLAEGESGVRIRRTYAAELQRAFGPLLPSVVISHVGSAGKRIADALRQRLPDYGISAWPELPASGNQQDEWQQITGLLDQSKALVLVVAPNGRDAEGLRRQWRYARQQGIAVFLVAPGEAIDADKSALPRWMREAHCYDLDREWDALARLLQNPPQASRVPFMAPDLPPHYVERTQAMSQLNAALLTGEPQSRHVGLWGLGGCGKTVLATAFCQSEDTIAHFSGGILWVRLGKNPNVTTELTKLYTALTGERQHFETEAEAAQQLGERLSERHCLLVIEDVWELQHLKPFLHSGPRCKRLILTRDLNILTTIGATWIEVAEVTLDEAVVLLTASLQLSPGDTALFLPFAERLGYWPLALHLANAQLRKRLGQGESVRSALDYLAQALDKFGVLAFDQPDALDSDESVARSVAFSLRQLTPDELEHYLQIVFFPEGETLTPEKLSTRWGHDAFETGKLLQRFAELSLLQYDLNTKIVKLRRVLRDYILNPASGYADLNRRCDAAFEPLSSDEQKVAQRILTRLVRLALPNEQAADTRLKLKLSEFNAAEQQVISTLIDTRLLEVEAEPNSSEKIVQLSSAEILRSWTRLQSWLNEDREFLLWRQSLRRSLAEWEEHRDHGALLSGAPLRIAVQRQRERGHDLNQHEHTYINESECEAEEKVRSAAENLQLAREREQALRRWRRWGIIGATLGIVAAVAFWSYQMHEIRQVTAIATTLNAQGRILAEEGKLDEAIAKFQEAVMRKADYGEVYANLGDALRKKGSIDEAIKAYTRALELNPTNPEASVGLGEAYARQREFEKAITN